MMLITGFTVSLKLVRDSSFAGNLRSPVYVPCRNSDPGTPPGFEDGWKSGYQPLLACWLERVCSFNRLAWGGGSCGEPPVPGVLVLTAAMSVRRAVIYRFKLQL